jgi:hypothetical protein
MATMLAGVCLPGAATAAQAQPLGATGTAASAADHIAGSIAHDDDDDDDDGVCVDATQRRNLRVEWHGSSKVKVHTKDHRMPCAETRVIFSVYVMPDTWDGKGFNETALPQKHIQSTRSVVLTDDEATFELDPVNPCFNTQSDVYYAPQIDDLSWPEGHNQQFISARFRPAEYQ